jgi:hypothetical protein
MNNYITGEFPSFPSPQKWDYPKTIAPLSREEVHGKIISPLYLSSSGQPGNLR